MSLEARPGAFTALLGPNGAGKSTLFALLTRLLVAPDGRIVIAGHNLSREPRKALARMGVVFQQPTLDLDLTVRRSLRYFAGLHGLAGKTAEAAIDAALDQLGMRERAGEKVRALNGGHRQADGNRAGADPRAGRACCWMNPRLGSMPRPGQRSPPMCMI